MEIGSTQQLHLGGHILWFQSGTCQVWNVGIKLMVPDVHTVSVGSSMRATFVKWGVTSERHCTTSASAFTAKRKSLSNMSYDVI